MAIPEESKTGRKAVLFYENWWLMAESRDTGPKRLAFYDAIMRFAFLGEVPHTPEKGVSAGEAWAAHDGYLVCKPILDGTVEKEAQKENCRKAGLSGKGEVKARFGNKNAIKEEEQNSILENATGNATENATRCDLKTQRVAFLENTQNATRCVSLINIKEKGNINQNPKPSTEGRGRDGSLSDDENSMFVAWWQAYPGIRKQDKRKCADKFARVLRKSGDAVSLFNRIMDGLDKWKRCETWTKDGGRYVCAPLVWLNNERWEAEIKVGPLTTSGIDNIHQEQQMEQEVSNAF